LRWLLVSRTSQSAIASFSAFSLAWKWQHVRLIPKARQALPIVALQDGDDLAVGETGGRYAELSRSEAGKFDVQTVSFGRGMTEPGAPRNSSLGHIA
jgi:hypothetical protein